ncbi:MAG: 4Fe-4S dicluster domain-containing protein [Dethiobacter sp.]|jgi:ferredoxin like protein|nr:4Fe-4S dicluster domain-containing protein [Dethiobacter sp.]MBS3901738.1 4Fe-4S dicluster domain-containing protein [Dethiobacter sp.]MBS3988534.1 4Fe-4S dicluster domain-containing protein [Dethiobacter sp.]MBS3989560.1 4Fe-4S dicluster domain-containing protein [Dethiobacter sp.]
MGGEDYLQLLKIIPASKSHIIIKDTERCKLCEMRGCLFVCPSAVFSWDEELQKPEVLWRRCLECGACEPACPENVEYGHPRGGFGVAYFL